MNLRLTLAMRKWIILGLVILVAVLGIAIGKLGYHGPRSFPDGTSSTLPPVGMVVANARLLSGAPYDPFLGSHGIGAALGFIVCSDVPNIAYGRSGFSLQALLRQDFQLHPGAYDTTHGNDPRNPYFHRRARNLYAYFQVNGRALPPNAHPAVGDLAFYHNHPGGEVSHVTLVTSVDTDGGYHVMESDPITILAGELDGTAPLKRGLLLVGFGRMYPAAK